MRRSLCGLLLVLALCFTTVTAHGGSPVVSTMRNVNAVMDAQGFRINPAFDHSGAVIEGDLAPVQAFEIVRPDNRAFSIGRLYTSCTCIQLEAPKRSYAAGERAILNLRNTRPTPVNGQIYAIYVQITSPIRATLRFDTFVQSNPAGQDLLTEVPENSIDDPEALGYDVIVPSADDDFDVVATTDAVSNTEEENEAGAIAEDAYTAVQDALEDEAPLAGEYSDEGERQAIAAAVEARVADAESATREIADDMDAYFTEQEAPAVPVALPPPEDVVAQFEEAAESAIDASGADIVATATPLEEAYQSSGTAETDFAAEPELRAETGPPATSAMRNIALITIGVRDLDRSIRFYEALGWTMAPRGKYDQTAFFQLNGQVLVLYPMPELLREQNMADAAPAPGGITLAIHVSSKDEVIDTYQRFLEAGGMSLKEPTQMLSGSVTSYVADPDGNPWEISWVPQFRVDEDGWLWLP